MPNEVSTTIVSTVGSGWYTFFSFGDYTFSSRSEEDIKFSTGVDSGSSILLVPLEHSFRSQSVTVPGQYTVLFRTGWYHSTMSIVAPSGSGADPFVSPVYLLRSGGPDLRLRLAWLERPRR